jgi:hypothetical protein
VDLVDGELVSSRGLPRKFRRLDSAGDMVRVFASSRKGGTMHLKSNGMNAAILDLVLDRDQQRPLFPHRVGTK